MKDLEVLGWVACSMGWTTSRRGLCFYCLVFRLFSLYLTFIIKICTMTWAWIKFDQIGNLARSTTWCSSAPPWWSRLCSRTRSASRKTQSRRARSCPPYSSRPASPLCSSRRSESGYLSFRAARSPSSCLHLHSWTLHSGSVGRSPLLQRTALPQLLPQMDSFTPGFERYSRYSSLPLILTEWHNRSYHNI